MMDSDMVGLGRLGAALPTPSSGRCETAMRGFPGAPNLSRRDERGRENKSSGGISQYFRL